MDGWIEREREREREIAQNVYFHTMHRLKELLDRLKESIMSSQCLSCHGSSYSPFQMRAEITKHERELAASSNSAVKVAYDASLIKVCTVLKLQTRILCLVAHAMVGKKHPRILLSVLLAERHHRQVSANIRPGKGEDSAARNGLYSLTQRNYFVCIVKRAQRKQQPYNRGMSPLAERLHG